MEEERLGRIMDERDIEKKEIWNVMRKVKDKKRWGETGYRTRYGNMKGKR